MSRRLPHVLAKKLRGVVQAWDGTKGCAKLKDGRVVRFHWTAIFGWESDSPLRIGDQVAIDSDGLDGDLVLYEAMVVIHPLACRCEFCVQGLNDRRGAQ